MKTLKLGTDTSMADRPTDRTGSVRNVACTMILLLGGPVFDEIFQRGFLLSFCSATPRTTLLLMRAMFDAAHIHTQVVSGNEPARRTTAIAIMHNARARVRKRLCPLDSRADDRGELNKDDDDKRTSSFHSRLRKRDGHR